MKVNPQQAPLYGKCVLTVVLSDAEVAQVRQVCQEDGEGAELYLLFSGSTQRHLCSTRRTHDHGTLQAICPAHDCCEIVQVTLCVARSPVGGASTNNDQPEPEPEATPTSTPVHTPVPVQHLGQVCFGFVQDLAFDMAQYLVSCVGRADAEGLEGVLMLDDYTIPQQECERLDHNLALALKHLHLPTGWSLLGTHLGTETDPEPHETLLHFACRRGLVRVASFLLRQRGALEALRLPNTQGLTPHTLAQRHPSVMELLDREEGVALEREYDDDATVFRCRLSCGGFGVLEHHSSLGTYTLTVELRPLTHTHSRTPSDTQAPTQDTQSFGTGLQQDTQELWSLVQKHTHHSQKAGEALTTPLGQPDSNSNEGSPAHQHSHRENTHACEITSGDTHTREKISGPPHPSRDPDSPRVVGRSATPPQPPPPSPPPLPLHPLHLPVPLPPLPLLLSLLVGEARPSQPAISSPSNQQDGGKQQQQQQQPPERSAEEHEEEECVCGNPGSDSSVTPSQQHTTTATETRAVGEEQGARVGIDSGLDNTHTTQEHTAGATADTTAEGEEEHTGEEGSSGVQGDTQLVNTLTDSHTHREPGGASGEEAVSPRRSGGEQEEESTSSSTAQDLISSAQGAAEREVSQQEEGEQKEEEEEGKREEEKEEEEEVEPLPDQKHPSGLGGVADAAEVRGTAEQSPDTHEHSPVTEEQSPATAAAEQRTDTAETEQAAPAAEICTESAARTTEQKTESDGTATATQIEPTAIEIESTRTEPESTEIESARTAAESTRTELECTASEVSSAGTEGESTGSCTRTVKAVTTVTEADMGLTQSQTDQEVSDLDSRHTEAEGGEEKEEREEEEEEEEDRDESEEYLDASSTSMEGEYLLFEECDDSVVDSPSNTGPGANVSDPTQREEVASTEKSESSFQDCIEGETSTDCVVPAQTEEGSVELETQATSDFSATATASPCLQEASGHQGTDDGLSNITSGNDYDITARVSCDSGSEDLPDLTTIIADQQEVTSLGGVMPAGDACHTHLRDITEHEFSEDTHTQEDLTSIPECRAAGAAAVAECDMDTSEGNVPSSQDKVGEEMECQPSCHIAPDEVVLEVEEEGEVQGEIPSDVCPSQSEEALHASSNDTQEEVEKEVNEETQKEVKEVEDGVREEKDICPSHSDESQPACCDDSPSVLEGEVRRHREEKETQQEVYSEESRPASSDDTLEVEAQGHQEVYSDACPSHSEDSRPASSDACPSHSEDSRPASSDDTLEALDDDSSTMSESEQPTKTTRLQRIKQLQLDTTDGSDTQVCEEEEESSPQETSSPDLAHTPEHTPAAPSDESSEGKAGRRDAAHESTCPETVTDAQTGDFERGQSATGGSSDTHSHTLTHIQSHNDGYSDTLTYTHAHDDRCQGSESAQQHTTSTPTISNTTATTTTTSSPPSEGGAAETGHSPEKEFEEEARGVRTTPSHHHQHQASKQGRSEVTEELRREETAPPITSAPRTKQRALLDAAVSMETKQEVAEEVRVAGQRSGGADGEMFPAGGHVHGRKSAMRRVAGRHLTPALSLDSHTTPIHTDKECFGAAPHTLSHTHSHTHSQTHTHTHRSLERGPSIDSADSPQSSRSSISTLQRDSGSDTDGFCSTDTGEDNVFRKDECVTCGGGDSTSEVSVSCSSTDDAASLGHRSSSSTSSSRSSSSRLLSARLRQTHSHTHSHAHSHTRHGAVVVTTGSATGSGGGGGAAGLVSVDTEEEAKDCVSEVPLRSSLLRNSIRSLSPFRRHSWGPGKNAAGEGDMNQRSLSWCPSDESMSPCVDQCSDFSFSLEGLVGSDGVDGKSWQPHGAGGTSQGGRRAVGRQESDDRGSLVSLTEEEHEHESDMADSSSLDSQKSRRYQPQRRSAPSMTLPLTKSVSMLAISQRDIDAIGRIRQKRRLSFGFNFSTMRSKMSRQQTVSSSSSDERGEEDEYDEEEIDDVSMNSYSSNMGSVDCSITEEGLGPLRDFDGKGSTKVSRTFSYLKSKMSKRSRDKDSRHKEKEAREREKQRASSGHVFGLAASHQTTMCPQCHKAVSAKDAFVCNNCYVCVHKGCRDSLPVCAKVNTKKQHYAVPDSSTLPTVTLRPKSSSSRERPWSAILSPEEHSLATAPRRHTLMPFNSSNLSKSISISNIAGHQMFDDMPSLKGLRYLSQSTDSLNKPSRVHESTESLVDEGTEMIDSQLLGEFEADARELENDSWSFSVDKKTLKHLKKDTIKRQDVIYELIQTELHHVRTLRVMGEVYCKGLQKEVGLECAVLDRMFPALDDLLDLHTHFLSSMLERKREAQILAAQQHSQAFVIERIGDVLIEQFSGPTAECMKRVYGKFCSRHNEAVNLYKEHHAKDKRFQAFIKRKMSSSIVRRMGIPECILLVTQRITKYPVLLQRILHHTRDDDEEYEEVSQALSLVKEAVAAVDVRVNEQEKRKRLKEIHSRTDSKSIMRMKSGQMFAREDLLRRRLVHDGALQLKTNTGRLKDVQAVLLSDILVFLQEKDQKYVFASLDQRSTVLSLQKLIAREVANEERALFLITAGTERPEMVEVHASTKEDRNAWMQLLQQTMQSIEKDEDEGIPSENEEDKRLMESKAKELREVLQRKDEQIVLLLQEKMKLFRDMCDCPPPASPDDPSGSSALVYKMLFRACSEDVPKGEPIMINALKEVEMLQTLVNGSLGGAVGQQVSQDGVGGVGPVVLPRRAETFGGFDSHQLNTMSKSGDKEDGEEAADLRRTESDSVLKKGGNANLLLLLKRNSEVLHSVTNLHDLLASLQAVVVQQDTFIEDQRQALSERPSSVSSSSSITSSTSSSRASSRPNSLIEQERQRSLEKQRQEATALQRQRDAHAEERKRRERHWETRERDLAEKEAQTAAREEELRRKRRELEQAKQELQQRKEDYQRDLERLRDGQRRLEREREALEQAREEKHIQRTPSSTSEDSLYLHSASVFLEPDPHTADNDASRKHSLGRLEPPTTTKAKGLNQMPSRFLQLTKGHKDKKEKKKKKNKHPLAPESSLLPLTEPVTDGEIYFC